MANDRPTNDTPAGQSPVQAQINAMLGLLRAEEAADKALADSPDTGVILDPAAFLGQTGSEPLVAERPADEPLAFEPPAVEPDCYCVHVETVGQNKATLLSVVGDLTGLEFFEVVKLVDRIPGTLMFSTNRAVAEAAVIKIAFAGAKCEVVCQKKVPDMAVLIGEDDPKAAESAPVRGFYPSNDVVLVDAGKGTGQVSRVVRSLTGKSYHAAMYLLESLPATVLSGVSALEASRAKTSFELQGAKVLVEPSKQ